MDGALLEVSQKAGGFLLPSTASLSEAVDTIEAIGKAESAASRSSSQFSSNFVTGLAIGLIIN